VFSASRSPWSGEGREAENTAFEGNRTVRSDRTCPRREPCGKPTEEGLGQTRQPEANSTHKHSRKAHGDKAQIASDVHGKITDYVYDMLEALLGLDPVFR